MLPNQHEEVVLNGGNHAYYGNYGEQKVDGAFLPLSTFTLALH